MKCPKCNTESQDGVKFCHECGAQLPQPASIGVKTVWVLTCSTSYPESAEIESDVEVFGSRQEAEAAMLASAEELREDGLEGRNGEDFEKALETGRLARVTWLCNGEYMMLWRISKFEV